MLNKPANLLRSCTIVCVCLTLLLGAVTSYGSTITFVTPAGSSTGGGPVNASATFVTTVNTLTITLQDLLANPTDVAQLISDLSFGVSGGTLSGSILLSSSGQEINVAGNGSFTLGATVATGWAYTSGATTGTLNVLGTPTAPSHLIIGPPGGGGFYSNANGSIAGNPAHNPFLNQTATFTIIGPNLGTGTTITSATFSFGTVPGSNVPGIPSTTVPEPGTMALLGAGLLGSVGLLRRRLLR